MKLAIEGGAPVRRKPFPAYRTVGAEEKEAVERVLETGVLSRYLGTWHPDFMGGPQVRALEEEWAAYFKVKHAVAVNSCTSGLICAVAAARLEPGDEVIVSPYTMSATAVAPLVFNAVPVFADVEPDCFCLDPASIEARITERTKAIMVVDLFGQPYDRAAINALAEKHGLVVIEDAAQAPGARHGQRFAGTLGHMGVFSLNYHKHIHCGEGGVVVTDDDDLFERLCLVRNHAESVVEGMGVSDLVNLLGFNLRMTEMEAAVARCQLGKLEGLLRPRQENCAYLAQRLGAIEAIKAPPVRPECQHAYYVQPFLFDDAAAGVSRDRFLDAVKAELPHTELREGEGVKIGSGYVKPLYLLPMFQAKICYGSQGSPFKAPWYSGAVDYSPGICPVVERLHQQELFTHELMHAFMGPQDLEDVAKAFEKVWELRHRL